MIDLPPSKGEGSPHPLASSSATWSAASYAEQYAAYVLSDFNEYASR